MRRLLRVAILRHLSKIAAKRFQREFLGVNLAPGPNTTSAKDRNRWAPALNRVLKQERQNNAWNGEKLLVHKYTENCTGKRQGRRVKLQPALDVPFLFQFSDATAQGSGRLTSRTHQPTRRLSF